MDTSLSSKTTAQVNIVNQSFMWMFAGLVITGFSSLFIATNDMLINTLLSHTILYYGLMFGELALVFFLTLRITKISFEAALISFFGYSLLNGITFSIILLIQLSK